MAVAVRPIRISQGLTYSHTIEFRTSPTADPALPTTNLEATLHRPDDPDPLLVADWVLDEDEGRATFFFTDEQTETLSAATTYRYRVRRLDGQPRNVLTGPVSVAGVTP